MGGEYGDGSFLIASYNGSHAINLYSRLPPPSCWLCWVNIKKPGIIIPSSIPFISFNLFVYVSYLYNIEDIIMYY